jgi:hypothetical protein
VFVFNRRRYDATQTITSFSTRLRQQVDLNTLTTELLGVVEQTMQPTSVSLWLRTPLRPLSRRSPACPPAPCTAGTPGTFADHEPG